MVHVQRGARAEQRGSLDGPDAELLFLVRLLCGQTLCLHFSLDPLYRRLMNIWSLFRPTDATQNERLLLEMGFLTNHWAAVVLGRVLLNNLVLDAIQEKALMMAYRRLMNLSWPVAPLISS